MEQIITHKPWGYEKKLTDDSELFWVKILTIKPEQRLSLQSHKNRKETWVVLEGEGVVTLDDEKYLIKKLDNILIPEGVKHRVHNIDKQNVLIICEVATGVPKDSDIARIEDDYGRK